MTHHISDMIRLHTKFTTFSDSYDTKQSCQPLGCDSINLRNDVCEVKLDNEKYDYESSVHFNAVCIDGLSGVGKTTFGNRYYGDSMKKPNGGRYIARNTHPSSCISYVYDYIRFMKENENQFTVYDRMPINTLMWNSIWDMMMIVGNGNLEDYTNELIKCTEYLPDVIMERFGRLAKNIIIVDTDHERATTRLRKRGQGKDVERSNLKNYIKIQVFAYTMLCKRWPHLFYYVDLNDFDGDQNRMHEFLHILITERFSNLRVECDFDFSQLYKSGKEMLCTNTKRESLRPIMSERFSNDAKVHFCDDDSKRKSFELYSDRDTNTVYFAPAHVNCQLVMSVRVFDPQSLWRTIQKCAYEKHNATKLTDEIIQFESANDFDSFVKSLSC